MASDEQQIVTLMMRYAELQDATDLAGVAELFRHGAFVVDRVGVANRGTAEVLAVKQAHDRLYPDGTLRTKHVTTNVIVEVDEGGETARARSYYVVFQATDELPLQPIIAGRYSDTFRRHDGAWWFEERYVHTDLVGDLSGHIAGDPLGLDAR